MAPTCWASLLLLALTSPLVSGYPHPSRKYTTLVERAAEEYDYVIVGGGTAGLTVGDRLTEDGKYTVLVIENGVLGKSLNDVLVEEDITLLS